MILGLVLLIHVNVCVQIQISSDKKCATIHFPDFPCMGLQMDRWTGGPATVPVYIFTQRKIDGW